MENRLHHESLFIQWLFYLCETFAVASFLYFTQYGSWTDILLSGATVLLLAGIYAAPILFRFHISPLFCAFAFFYAMGPMLGECFRLYYLTAYFDKLLHTSAGVFFAILGAYIPVLIDPKYKDDILLRAVFAVGFSVAVSVFWEFYEFGVDMLFGMDMQNDTVIHSISSYLLGAQPGVRGSIDAIDSIVINGEVMEGYIDIGLIDTMMDMLVETIGAIQYAVFFLLDKNAHPVFQPIPEPAVSAVQQSPIGLPSAS